MDVMTPNIDRLLAALSHKKHDRVPNFEILIDDRATRYILGMPENSGDDEKVNLWSLPPEKAVELVSAVGQDAVTCSLTWMAAQNGSICTDADFETLVTPNPQLATATMQPYFDATAGTDVGLIARVSGPLTLAYMAMGPIPIESFMLHLYDNLPLVERVMDRFLDYHLAVIDAIADRPFHAFYIGDDIASSTGPLISPAMLAELWAPRMGQLIAAAQSTGKPVIVHCCGMLAPVLPWLCKWGVSAVHPIQPVANDIYKIHADVGDRLTLIGNIDVAEELSFGTAEETRQSTKQHIDRLAGQGGYIVCSSHSIIDSVKPENYLAMCKATQEFGIFK